MTFAIYLHKNLIIMTAFNERDRMEVICTCKREWKNILTKKIFFSLLST